MAKLNNAHALLAALKDLLGDCEDIVRRKGRDICRHCGRDFTDDNREFARYGEILLYDCPSGDCPGYIARAAIAQAERTIS